MMVMIKDDDLYYVGTGDLVVADIMLRIGNALEKKEITTDQANALLQQTCACGQNPVCECVPA